MYFACKARTIKSVQVKFRDVKQLGSMHLYTKLQRSTFRHLEEIGVESCQNVSALPADKLLKFFFAIPDGDPRCKKLGYDKIQNKVVKNKQQ